MEPTTGAADGHSDSRCHAVRSQAVGASVQYLDAGSAAKYLGVSVSFLAKRRLAGDGSRRST